MKKSKTKRRKQKFVVWLYNNTDRRDDDWKSVFANTAAEAEKLVEFDSSRFTMGPVYTAKEFREMMGFSA